MTSNSMGRWGLLGLAGGATLLQFGGCAPILGETLVRIAFDLVFIPISDAVQQALITALG